VPEDVALARLAAAGRPPDRFEAEDGGFHRRVHEGFLTLASAEPTRWAVVDGTGTPEEVAARVIDAVRSRLAT